MKSGVNDNILSLIGRTPDSLMSGIAESAGEISLRSLVTLAFALDMTDEFETLFSSKTYQSIDDLLKAEQPIQRKRGHRNTTFHP